MLLSVLLNRSSGVRERGHFIINFARGEKLLRSTASLTISALILSVLLSRVMRVLCRLLMKMQPNFPTIKGE